MLAATLVAATTALCLGHASDAGAAGLTLRATDAPGFKRVTSSPAAARRSVARGMGRRAARIIRRSRAQSAAFRQRDWRLRSHAFTTRNTASARRALAGWRAKYRRTHWKLRRQRIGAGGWLARRGRRTAVAWRHRNVLAVIDLPRGPRAMAAGYARLAQHRMRGARSATAWDRLLARIPPGRVSTKHALQAFSLALRRLPGVRLPRGRRARVHSGTLAIRWILDRFDDLTPAQRATVQRTLDVRIGGPGPRTAAAAADDFVPDAGLQATAQRFYRQYVSWIGIPDKMKLVVGKGQGSRDYANTFALNAAGQAAQRGEAVAGCRTAVMPVGLEAEGGASVDLFLAHEMFHCVQMQILDTRNATYGRHVWITEGMTDYAAVKSTGGSFKGRPGANLRGYLNSSETELFARAGDGAGFWAHVDETAGLFPRVPAILREVGDAGAFAAANGLNDFQLDTWASRDSGIELNGSMWTHGLPIRWDSFGEHARLEHMAPVRAPSLVPVHAPAYRNRLYHVGPIAPVIYVNMAGNARLGDGGSVDTSDLYGRYFCTIKECKCPKGQEGTVPPTTPLAQGKPVYLAVSGRPGEGSRGTLRGMRLEDFCKEKRPKPKPPVLRPIGRRPNKGKGSTNGDPHMRTGDRLAYDFQAAGEFTLVRSGTDNLEIQARQEPMLRDDSVTINSALAMNVAGDRVTVERGDPPVVRAGGRLLNGTTTLPRGGQIQRFDEDALVTWPDGSEAFVWPVGDWGVAVSFSAAPDRAGKLAGLLGNYDGNPNNDLTTRDGQTLDPAIAGNGRATEPLYKRFGESWRIAQNASLFDYDRGKSTASYTNRALPKDAPTLSDWDRRVAESICRQSRIADPRLMRDCVTDVALGGDDAFAEAAAVQQAVEAAPQPPPAEPETPIAWSHVSALDARAGQVGLGTGRDGTLHALAAVRRGDDEDVVHVPIGADGTIGETSTVAAGLDGEPTVTTAPNGGLHVTMPALGSDASGAFTFDAPASGANWTRGPLVSTTNYAYSGYGQAVYGPGGELLTVLSTNGYGRVFRGTQPQAGDGVELAPGTGCYAGSPAIATDGQAVWAVWEQFGCAQEGLFAARIDPATGQRIGTAEQIPGARTLTNLSQQVALAARPDGGGVWIAYAAGDDVRIHRLGTGQTLAAATAPGVNRIALSGDPSGRLWVAWQAGGRLRARRTAPDATLEPPTYLPTLPPGRTPETTDWTVQARDGQLDLLAGGETTSNWHGAIRP